MAYVELGMWEILDVLRRVQRGEAKSAIARVTGRTRPTIRRYLKVAAKLGWEPGGVEPDEALAARVAQRLRPGPPETAEGSAVVALLAPHREQLHRYATQQCGFQYRRRITVLYSVVHEQLETFLARARERERPVPRFVERTLRAFLGCGILAHGFVRIPARPAATTVSSPSPARAAASAPRAAGGAGRHGRPPRRPGGARGAWSIWLPPSWARGAVPVADPPGARLSRSSSWRR